MKASEYSANFKSSSSTTSFGDTSPGPAEPSSGSSVNLVMANGFIFHYKIYKHFRKINDSAVLHFLHEFFREH